MTPKEKFVVAILVFFVTWVASFFFSISTFAGFSIWIATLIEGAIAGWLFGEMRFSGEGKR